MRIPLNTQFTISCQKCSRESANVLFSFSKQGFRSLIRNREGNLMFVQYTQQDGAVDCHQRLETTTQS